MISISKRKEIKGNAHKFFTPKEVTTFKQVQLIVTNCVWSPIIWAGGVRHRDNFISSKYMALDFDTGDWTLKDAKNWVTEGNYSAIIGTSKSHQIEKKTASGVVSPAVDRFRIVMPFKHIITDRYQYEENMRAVMKDIPCDKSCKDAARFFYPCKIITDINIGVGYPVTEYEEESEDQTDETIDTMQEAGRSNVLPGWIISALRFGVEEGTRHHMCYRLGANLIWAGFSEDYIVEMIMLGPLSKIGKHEVERAVRNGANASRRRQEEKRS